MNYQSLLQVEGDNARTPEGSFRIPTFEPLGPAEGQAPPILGSISDSNWSRVALKDFDLKMEAALGNLAQDARKAMNADLGQFIPEARDLKRAEIVAPVLERIERHVAEAVASAGQAADFARKVEESAMTVAEPKDPIAALRQDMAAQELRQAVAQLPAKEKHTAVQNLIERRDLFGLHALLNSPLPLLDSNGQLLIERGRRELAHSRFPWLATMVEHHSHVNHATGVRAAEYMREARRILTQHGLDLERVKQYQRALGKRAA